MPYEQRYTNEDPNAAGLESMAGQSTTSWELESHPNKLSSAMNEEGKEGGKRRRNVRILTLLSYKGNSHGTGMTVRPLGTSKRDLMKKNHLGTTKIHCISKETNQGQSGQRTKTDTA